MADAAGNYSTVTGTVTIQGVSSVSAAPAQFNPSAGETTPPPDDPEWPGGPEVPTDQLGSRTDATGEFAVEGAT